MTLERTSADASATHGPDLSAVGERIEVLLEASSSAGVVHRERAEELVGLVTDLYGTGLERILEILDDEGLLTDETLGKLLADDLLSSLFLVHGLHPHDVEQRVQDALDHVRPYLGSHGGDVELLSVNAEGVVTLRMLGSCDGCPSSAVTLELAVESAIEAAAPEVTQITVETVAPASTDGAAVISIDSLRVRLDGSVSPGDVEWVAVDVLDELAEHEIAGFELGQGTVFACRAGDDVFVYRDVCTACAGSFAGRALVDLDDGILAIRCPTCDRSYDIRRAGAEIGTGRGHLDPLPALVRDQAWHVAVPVGAH